MFKKVLNQDAVWDPKRMVLKDPSEWPLGQNWPGTDDSTVLPPRPREVSEAHTSSAQLYKSARLQHSTLPRLHAWHRSYTEYKWGQNLHHISYFPCTSIPKKEMKMIIKFPFKNSQKVVSFVQNGVLDNFFVPQGPLFVIEKLFAGKKFQQKGSPVLRGGLCPW